MATVDEILGNMQEDTEDEPTTTINKICAVNSEARTIDIPLSIQTVGVASDEDVRRINFECPQVYEGVDLGEFNIYINYVNANNEANIYEVEDAVTYQGMLRFSWLVSRNVTAKAGNVKFIICMKKLAEDSTILQEWHTTIATLHILEGLEARSVAENSIDILDQWKTKLFGLTESGKTTIEDVSLAEQVNLTEKGKVEQQKVETKSTEEQKKITSLATAHKQEMQEIKDSIPQDYNTLSTNMTTVLDTFADGIKNSASGSVVALDDSSNKKCEIEILGKTEQLSTKGLNLLNPANINGSFGGVTISYDGNAYTVNGTCNSDNADIYTCGKWASKTVLFTGVNTVKWYGATADERLMIVNNNVVYNGAATGAESSTVNGDITAIMLRLKNGKAYNNYKISPMVCSGSTEKPYEPYTGGVPSPSPEFPQAVKGVGESGKIKLRERTSQLINPYTMFTKPVVVSKGITYTKKDDGTFTAVGTSTDNHANAISIDLKDTLPRGTYFINYTTTDNNVYVRIVIKRGASTIYYKNESFTVHGDEDYIAVQAQIDKAGTTVNATVKPMLNFGNSALPFEQYKECNYDIPVTSHLYGLDKQDRICKKDGVWGIESWMQYGTSRDIKLVYEQAGSDSNYIIMKTWSKGNIGHNNGMIKCKCSHFTVLDKTDISGTVYTKFYCYQHEDKIEYKLAIARSDFPSFSDTLTTEYLHQKLAELGVYFLVPLGTPTFEPFHEEIQQKLNALTTYSSTTVMYTTDELRPTINVNYVADTKLYINKRIKEEVEKIIQANANTLALLPTDVQATMIENDTNNLLQSI